MSKNKFILYNDYHYTYYFWDKGSFSFCDRESISIKQIIDNRDLVDRFTFQGVDKIKVRKHSYRLVLDSPYVKDKKKCKQIINEAIYNKYVTLGIINQKFHRKNSIKFLFRSLLYKFDRKTMNILLKIVLFGKEKYVYIESKELDLM